MKVGSDSAETSFLDCDYDHHDPYEDDSAEIDPERQVLLLVCIHDALVAIICSTYPLGPRVC